MINPLIQAMLATIHRVRKPVRRRFGTESDERAFNKRVAKKKRKK